MTTWITVILYIEDVDLNEELAQKYDTAAESSSTLRMWI